MSKVLIVMYSYTGTCRRLAHILRAQQKWPLTEIREVRPRSGIWSMWRCVLDSALRRRPAIRLDGPPPAGFDAVVLIAPVWAMRLASPMRSFVALYGKSLPRVAAISVMAGSAAPAAGAEVTRLLGRSPILGTAFQARDVDDGSCAARLQAFGQAVRSVLAPATPARPAVWSTQSA